METRRLLVNVMFIGKANGHEPFTKSAIIPIKKEKTEASDAANQMNETISDCIKRLSKKNNDPNFILTSHSTIWLD